MESVLHEIFFFCPIGHERRRRRQKGVEGRMKRDEEEEGGSSLSTCLGQKEEGNGNRRKGRGIGS
jgi:hypothetical protein